MKSDDFYILYNNNIVPRSCIRFTLMHEVSHIMLNHDTQIICYTKKSNIKNQSKHSNNILELEANIFSLCFLAPSCVLIALNIHNETAIMELCGLPYIISKKKLEYLQFLYKNNIFLRNSLEKNVYIQFIPFIESYKNKS